VGINTKLIVIIIYNIVSLYCIPFLNYIEKFVRFSRETINKEEVCLGMKLYINPFKIRYGSANRKSGGVLAKIKDIHLHEHFNATLNEN
jgi:hypothetical protein